MRQKRSIFNLRFVIGYLELQSNLFKADTLEKCLMQCVCPMQIPKEVTCHANQNITAPLVVVSCSRAAKDFFPGVFTQASIKGTGKTCLIFNFFSSVRVNRTSKALKLKQ